MEINIFQQFESNNKFRYLTRKLVTFGFRRTTCIKYQIIEIKRNTHTLLIKVLPCSTNIIILLNSNSKTCFFFR